MTNATPTVNGSRNGVHPEPIHERDLMWDSLPPAVTQRLGEPLDEGLVSQR